MIVFGRPLGLWLIGVYILYGAVEGIFLLASNPQSYILASMLILVSLVLGVGILALNQWAAITLAVISFLLAFLVTLSALFILGVRATAESLDLLALLSQYLLEILSVLMCYLIAFYLSRKNIRRYFVQE